MFPEEPKSEGFSFEEHLMTILKSCEECIGRAKHDVAWHLPIRNNNVIAEIEKAKGHLSEVINILFAQPDPLPEGNGTSEPNPKYLLVKDNEIANEYAKWVSDSEWVYQRDIDRWTNKEEGNANLLTGDELYNKWYKQYLYLITPIDEMDMYIKLNEVYKTIKSKQ